MMNTDILHLGKYYPPYRGGIEGNVEILARHQSQLASVTVVAANHLRGTITEMQDGVRVVRVARYGVLASMAITPALPRHVRRYVPQLIHIHMPNPLAAASLVTIARAAPLVVTHHSDVLGRALLRCLISPVTKRVMERANVILISSQRYLDSSQELAPYRAKCRVVPLGVNAERFLAADEQAILALRRRYGADRYIAAVSRLVPYKGIDVAIRAMQNICAKLLVVGEGPQRGALDRLIRELHLEDKVVLGVRQEDIGALIHGCEVFILPSINRTESFGMAQIEAMIARRPVVNTLLDSGVPEISIDGLTGFSVTPGDALALAGAVNTLIHDRELGRRFGNAGHLRAMQLYTADRVAARVYAIYRELCPSLPHLADSPSLNLQPAASRSPEYDEMAQAGD